MIKSIAEIWETLKGDKFKEYQATNLEFKKGWSQDPGKKSMEIARKVILGYVSALAVIEIFQALMNLGQKLSK